MDKSTTPCADIRRLQAAIFDMDCIAQGAFSEISAIAKLALAALETPDGYHHPETIAHALLAIRGKADDTKNCIGCQAEEVGCNYQDPRAGRRMAARRMAMEGATIEKGTTE